MNEQKIIDMVEEMKDLKQSFLRLSFENTESNELNELFSALAKAQEEMSIASHNSTNPFFKSKYSDLASVVKASRPCLAKNGLSVIQLMQFQDGNTFLATRLCHASGQWIASKMPIKPIKSDIQSIGSYITYLRRYTYAAIVGVVASEDDDDAESAMNRTKTISPVHIKTLEKLINQLPPGIENKIFQGYDIASLNELKADNFNVVHARLKTLVEEESNEDN